jgi:hypothetical protein
VVAGIQAKTSSALISVALACTEFVLVVVLWPHLLLLLLLLLLAMPACC